MIVRDAPKPWQLLFILRGSIIPAIWPQLAFVVVLSTLVTWLDLTGTFKLPPISPLPFSLIGIALSIFAGFRNSASYERWWEGRRLLGQLVIECRSIARSALVYMSAEDGAFIAQSAVDFAHALRRHLRGELTTGDVMGHSGVHAGRAASYLPDKLLLVMSQTIASAHRSGSITSPLAQLMEERVVSLSAVLAGAERIKLTPLPFAYSLLLHRTAYLFSFLLPFGLADSTGIWTPALCAIVAYTFFGLDALGDELSTPFGTGQNALPLSAIVRTIEINIGELLGKEKLPLPLLPIEHVLD